MILDFKVPGVENRPSGTHNYQLCVPEARKYHHTTGSHTAEMSDIHRVMTSINLDQPEPMIG